MRQLQSIVERADYIRACKKASRFPFNYTAHYKSARGNRYTLIITATDKRKGCTNPLTSIYTTLDTREGKYMLRYDLVRQHVNIFTPHFFKRYRERALKQPTGLADEIIATFAVRNFNTACNFGKQLQTCSEGYIPTKEIDNGVSVCLTFISFDMLHDEQMDDADKLLAIIKRHEKDVEL